MGAVEHPARTAPSQGWRKRRVARRSLLLGLAAVTVSCTSTFPDLRHATFTCQGVASSQKPAPRLAGRAHGGAAKVQRSMLPGRTLRLRAAGSAVVDKDAIPARGLGLAARAVLSLVVGFAGLTGLLYFTAGIDSIMHRTSGIISGASPTVALLTGLATGGLHTFAGPDHLAGLSPLVIRQRRSFLGAFALGALWGSGHATGQFLIGLAFLAVHVGLLRTSWVPVLGQLSGVLVGLSLVLIGAIGFKEASEFKPEEEEKEEEEKSEQGRDVFTLATYATGVLHGLSPDAVFFILPALSLPRIAAIFHVVGVTVSSLVCMGCYTALLNALCRRSPKLSLVSGVASSIAIALGLCVLAASFRLSLPLPFLE
eukprot:TRINITY_DN1506_c2_g1_i1.p1 TRINITY_DN1506_c2_g1~~TRINITY_DN1506_c2_g1_i1.p1  ORF type:complete len:369 (-),score=50.66 TRINITY_DN1506_c2_g1_i1:256-1362(-)